MLNESSGALRFSIAARDIDGNGTPDLIIADKDSERISVLRNTLQPGFVTVRVVESMDVTGVSFTLETLNQPPSFTKGANQLVDEDAGTRTITNWATSISSGGSNEPAQAVDFVVTNDNENLFSVPPAISANGTLTYTTAENANGIATVTVRIHDDGGSANGGKDTSEPQSFTITVTALNDQPVANAQSASTPEDIAEEVTLAGADRDPEVTQSLTFSIVTPPSHGTLGTLDASTGRVTYTPDENYRGPDSFTFRVTDDTLAGGAALDSEVATVSLTVTPENDRPVATAQQVTTDQDAAISFSLTGVDGDAGENQALTFAIASQPQRGTLSGFNPATGAVTYTPNPGVIEPDSFTFTVTDDASAGGSALTSLPATVNLTVNRLFDVVFTGSGSNPLTATTPDGRLQITGTGVLIQVNQAVVPNTNNVESLFIRSLTINGAGGKDNLNLSGLSRSLFPRLREIVLSGNAGDDVIIGTSFDSNNVVERISGGAGNDLLNGSGGRDRLVETQTGTSALNVSLKAVTGSLTRLTLSGFGTDTIEAFEEMSLTGAGGADKIMVDLFPGNVTLIGGLGNDTLIGGALADSLNGGVGNDSLTGNGGDDQLLGDDPLVAGSGIDTITESDLANTLASNFVLTPISLLGRGSDTLSSIEKVKLTTSNVGSRIDASAYGGDTTLTGGNGNDLLIGGSGTDSIVGGKGNDTITGGLGKDTLTGGTDAGTADTLIENVSGTVTITATTLTTVISGPTTTVIEALSGFDAVSLTGGSGSDTINASALLFAVTLLGGGGSDTLTGGSSGDRLDGQSGDDVLTGGLGADTISGGDGVDRLVEVSKATVATNFTLTDFQESDAQVTGFGIAAVPETLSSIESASLTGGSNNDTLTAAGFTRGSVTLTGEANNDQFDGGAGTDRIVEAGFNFTISSVSPLVNGVSTGHGSLTGNGNDILLNNNIEEASLTGTTSANTLTAMNFSGAVTLNGLSGDDKLFGGSGNDQLNGGDGKDSLEGNGGGDTLFGNGGIDTLNGGAGADSLDGGNDNDSLGGQADQDTLIGGAGQDTLIGGAGADTLSGGEGNDILDGQADQDSLIGDDGRDILIGGSESDTLLGGLGEDVLIGESFMVNATVQQRTAAFNAILAEWTSSRTYEQRDANLRLGGGSVGTTRLYASTLQNDNAIDRLFGENARDLFFGLDSETPDRITTIGADQEFPR